MRLGDWLSKFSVPMTKPGQFAFFFCTQFLNYSLLVANGRAYTQGLYLWTWVTDSLLAGQSFIVAVLMINRKEGRSVWAGVGYTLGGPIGSLLSIYITKKLYGH
jgi:hypothetical protein